MKVLVRVVVLISAFAIAGCSGGNAREALLDGLYAAGKIAYDSLKGADPPGHR